MYPNSIHFFFLLLLFRATSPTCQWGPWTTTAQCEWIDTNCLKGYRRYCICDGKLSMGSACYGRVPSPVNYIETKPFVSNFFSEKGLCYKRDCPMMSNWCNWEQWTLWHPVTNATCHRHRIRKCCNSQPEVGYITKRVTNFGCFVSTSVRNNSSFSEEFKSGQCSPHWWWLKKVIYASIALGILIILIIICKCTGSKSVDKTRPNVIEIPFLQAQESNEPSAPCVDHPNDREIAQTSMPSTHDSNYPANPPTYDETIRNIFANPETSNENHNLFASGNEKKNFPDMNENSTMLHEENYDLNMVNIPPPTYTIYARNPNLFHPTM